MLWLALINQSSTSWKIDMEAEKNWFAKEASRLKVHLQVSVYPHVEALIPPNLPGLFVRH